VVFYDGDRVIGGGWIDYRKNRGDRKERRAKAFLCDLSELCGFFFV